jgi:ABC-type bacteriocin/lantibiotic exporter with double-glycine peptidase domain
LTCRSTNPRESNTRENPQRRRGLAIGLQVPFYRQASEFTCGPACLMMAMKFFQPNLRLSRELEFDIWREANLVESYGTSKEGLALAAARRGFEVYTIGKSLRHSFVDAIRDGIPGLDNVVVELFYDDTRRKFKAMGLKNKSRQIRLSNIRDILKKSHVPILLTSTSLFNENESPLPHWVVVTGFNHDNWYLNNPLGRSPRTRLARKQLQNNLGYRGVRCAVVICGRNQEL